MANIFTRLARRNVPPGIQKPILFKVIHMFLVGLGLAVRVCVALRLSTKAAMVKGFFRMASEKNKGKRIKSSDKIGIIDTQIKNVNVRIYKPKDQAENSPLVIYYHGGGFCIGSLDDFEQTTYRIAADLNIQVISVDYRLGPEHKCPAAVDDCWTVTDYIFKNPNEFDVDVTNIILAGDSAGGAAAAIMTQRLSNEPNRRKPKLEILIYPWMQHLNFTSPSYAHYDNKSLLAPTTTSLLDLVLWYMGYTEQNRQFCDELKASRHLLLVKDKQERKKLIDYLSMDFVDDEYKQGLSYYSSSGSGRKSKLDYFLVDAELDETSVLRKNQELAQIGLNLLKPDVSPGLVDDAQLKNLPATHVIVCEMDELKDEGLIYAERLRRNNVPVCVAYYRDGFHGILNSTREPMIDSNGVQMLNDIIDVIRQAIINKP